MDLGKSDKQQAEKDAVEEKIPDGQLKVKVYAPFRNYFEGFAVSVSAVNDTGPFDVLAGHHKFLTLLSQCDIAIRQDGEEDPVEVPIEKGVMFVQADKVSVFLDV